MNEDDYYRLFEELTGRCEYLLADGPMTSHELASVLERESFFADLDAENDPYAQEHHDLIDGVLAGSHTMLHHEGSGSWRLASTVFEGRIATHRLSAAEVAGDYLTITETIGFLDMGLEFGDAFGGAAVSDETNESERWVGQPGWLADYTPGDLCAVQRQEDALHLFPVDESELGDGALERGFIDRWHEGLDKGVGGDPFTWLFDAFMSEPRIFTEPTLPFEELMASAGFEERDGWYGRVGEDWVPPYVVAQQAELDELADRYELDPCCRSELDAVVAAWRAHLIAAQGTADADVDYRATADSLDHSFVAASFEDLVTSSDESDYDEYAAFVTALIVHGRRPAAAHYLLGRHKILREGRTLDGIESYKQAVDIDSDYPLAQYAMAEIEFYDGRFDDSIRRLRRAGMADADLLALAPQPTGATEYRAGRNEKCPCGSGRKFKACHGGSAAEPNISVRERLNAKLQRFALEDEQMERTQVVLAAVQGAHPMHARADDFAGLEFSLDLLMHEGRFLDEFLHTYGVLLKSDELALGTARANTRRDLYEITAVDPGSAVTLRSVRSNDTVVVSEKLGSQDVQIGSYLLARVLVDGPETDDPTLDADPLRIDMRYRDEVMDALDVDDPVASMFALASWFQRASSPPTIELGESLREALNDEEVDYLTSGAAWSAAQGTAPRKPPEPGSPEYEAVAMVIAQHEANWVTDSIPALGGARPDEAAADPTRRADLIRLLDSMPQTEDPLVMSGLRLRRRLGLEDD